MRTDLDDHWGMAVKEKTTSVYGSNNLVNDNAPNQNKDRSTGTSLVVQWLRLALPVQAAGV